MYYHRVKHIKERKLSKKNTQDTEKSKKNIELTSPELQTFQKDDSERGIEVKWKTYLTLFIFLGFLATGTSVSRLSAPGVVCSGSSVSSLEQSEGFGRPYV